MSLELATEILYRFEQSGRKLDEIMADATNELPDMMKTNTKYIVNRAVTWRGTFEQILKIYSNIKVEKIEKHLKALFFAAFAEFFFNKEKVPAKVINDALNLVQARSKRGFANAILRNISNDIKLKSAEDTVSRRIVGEYEFNQDIFADADQKSSKFISQAYSMPEWLCKKLLEAFPFNQVVEFAEASNTDAPLFIRTNTMFIEPEGLLEQMTEAGFTLEKTEHAGVFKLMINKSLIETEFFQEGLIYIQDLTSVLSSDLTKIQLKKDPKILDGCSAPGGKMTHIYEQLEGEGTFTAVEISKKKMGMLEENFKRLDHKIKLENGDFRRYAQQTTEKYDVVLLDVPCSNLGVLARNSDVRWRLKPEDIDALQILQNEMLESASMCLAPEGYINYSTCTILREENEERVASFLNTHPDFELVSEQSWLPKKHGSQGGYRAIIKKK